MSKVKIKLLSPDARIPKKAHPDDAGFDLFLPKSILISPGRHKIALDFAIELPKWHQAQIEPKSGISVEGIEGYREDDWYPGDRFNPKDMRHFLLDIIVGKIDANYRGCVHVIVDNPFKRWFYVLAGTKIAQMTIYELPHIDGFEPTDTLSETERGNGGFGSTGSKYVQ